MALVYLVNKPQVSRRINRWLLLSLKYDFIVVYKLGKIHVVTYGLLRLPDITKPTSVFDQTIDASLFYIETKWLKDVNFFLRTKQIKGMLLVQQK